MPRPNSNPTRLNDTNAIKRVGIKSPHPLSEDYVGGMSFSATSPGRNSSLAPPTRHPDTGRFSESSLRDGIEWLKRC